MPRAASPLGNLTVLEFACAPDSSRAVFRARTSSNPSFSAVFSRSLDLASAQVKLSQFANLTDGFLISPDSAHVALRYDLGGGFTVVHLAPADGSAPDIRLPHAVSASDHRHVEYAFEPDGAGLVVRGPMQGGTLLRVGVDDPAHGKLLTADSVMAFVPLRDRIVLVADHRIQDVFELFARSLLHNSWPAGPPRPGGDVVGH